MFGNNNNKEELERADNKVRTLEKIIADLERKINNMEAEKAGETQKHELEIKELEHTQKLELSTKEFDMRHFKDNELKTANDEKVILEQKLAVLTKENEMLIKITDLNADVIDVKELVASLIKKLPTVDINSINVTSK